MEVLGDVGPRRQPAGLFAGVVDPTAAKFADLVSRIAAREAIGPRKRIARSATFGRYRVPYQLTVHIADHGVRVPVGVPGLEPGTSAFRLVFRLHLNIRRVLRTQTRYVLFKLQSARKSRRKIAASSPAVLIKTIYRHDFVFQTTLRNSVVFFCCTFCCTEANSLLPQILPKGLLALMPPLPYVRTRGYHKTEARCTTSTPRWPGRVLLPPAQAKPQGVRRPPTHRGLRGHN